MFTVKKTTKTKYVAWDNFVKKANNGTMFHLRQFLSYHPSNRFIDHSIEFYKNNSLFSVFPAAEVIINKKKFLVSHPGSTVGSFVTEENLSISNSMKLVETLIHYAVQSGFDGVRLTVPPLFYYNRASNYLDYSLLKNGFDYFKREVTSTLFIEKNEESILKKFRGSHERAVRKAEKIGVEVKKTDKVEEFYNILKENLKIRHGVEPTHTLEELYKLINLFPKSINIFGAFHKGEMIAGVLNFLVKSDVALAFYISHKEDYQDLRPLNLLFYNIFKWALIENINVYDFGIFTVDGEPNMGLGRFKENFGASGIFRDTFQIIL
mgnify:FL=1|tara:strand:+ start:1258 stop:2223 length:966 start_codon:yes stop_codon:yes gene_type:complete